MEVAAEIVRHWYVMRRARIDRRAALRGLIQASSAAGLAAGATAPRVAHARRKPEGEMSLTILLDEPIATIQPTLYSQFIEHIGGVIYDGVWVGPDSKVAHFEGIRRALVEHVRQLGPVAIRWPGGCFADKYHWRDGIGPPERRPRRFGRWSEETETNQFGTHEFVRFCKLCGAVPYFAGNVGTGSPEEFQQWIEYCNAPAGSTTLAAERATNHGREPFRVRYWGVGNESWGCGGKFTPEDYCREYRRFCEWLPRYGVPLYLIAAGPSGNDLDWTRRFFDKWVDGERAAISGWAPHYYCGTTGHALQFNHDQWYLQLHKANRMERLIEDQWTVLGQFDRSHKIKLVIDEWGCWHPAGTEINKHHLYEQMSTLRDALVAALSLDTFNRHADKVDMANIAQLVNNLQSLFLADGDRFVATPNFHVYTMYRPHQGAKAVRIAVQAPEVSFRAGASEERLFRLAGSASQRSRNEVTLSVVHTHVREPAALLVRLRGGEAVSVRQTVLTHSGLNAHNTFDQPANLVPRSADSKGLGRVPVSELTCLLPPASINVFAIQLA